MAGAPRMPTGVGVAGIGCVSASAEGLLPAKDSGTGSRLGAKCGCSGSMVGGGMGSMAALAGGEGERRRLPFSSPGPAGAAAAAARVSETVGGAPVTKSAPAISSGVGSSAEKAARSSVRRWTAGW